MGAFIVADISFAASKDRVKFEKKYNWIRKKDIILDEKSNSYGFGAWTLLRNATVDVIYHLGFLGYSEPQMILEECLKEGIKIKFFAWIPINDRNCHWEKLRGRW